MVGNRGKQTVLKNDNQGKSTVLKSVLVAMVSPASLEAFAARMMQAQHVCM